MFPAVGGATVSIIIFLQYVMATIHNLQKVRHFISKVAPRKNHTFPPECDGMFLILSYFVRFEEPPKLVYWAVHFDMFPRDTAMFYYMMAANAGIEVGNFNAAHLCEANHVSISGDPWCMWGFWAKGDNHVHVVVAFKKN